MPVAVRSLRPEDFKRAFSLAVEFAFIDHPDDDAYETIDAEALARRMAPCSCGRIEVDDRDVDRGVLAQIAAEHGNCAARAVLVAAVDYAHRAYGCGGQARVIHEVHASRPAADEPAGLTALLDRLMAVHAAGTECRAVERAFDEPGTRVG